MEDEGKVGVNRDSLCMRQKASVVLVIRCNIINYGLIMSYTSGTYRIIEPSSLKCDCTTSVFPIGINGSGGIGK